MKLYRKVVLSAVSLLSFYFSVPWHFNSRVVEFRPSQKVVYLDIWRLGLSD